jgi:hypothetical protein
MLQIDETTVADHFSLATSDFCFYIWEYTAGRRYDFSLVDDVLNSGKHFKVAQEILSQRFPGTPVIGIFVARCIRSDTLVDLGVPPDP